MGIHNSCFAWYSRHSHPRVFTCFHCFHVQHCKNRRNLLIHWGRATHIYVGNVTNIGSDNGLSPGRRQAIIWTNVGILLIGPLGTNFSEILIEILTFSFKKMRLKVSSAKRRSFCLGLNVLNTVFLCGRCRRSLATETDVKLWFRDIIAEFRFNSYFCKFINVPNKETYERCSVTTPRSQM